MKILFVWTGITRCAGDCWRALADLPDVELKLVIHAAPDARLEAEVLHGLDYRIVDPPSSARFREAETGLPPDYRPDVLFVVGWHSPVVRRCVLRSDWADVPKVCCFDMPWRWSLRCFAARFVLGRFLRRFQFAYVPGASGERYARWLGFRRISRGFLSIDLAKFGKAGELGRRRAGFLYVGRKSSEKRLDLIARAHARYRALGGKWPMDYCHTTPYAQLPDVYARHACLILASERDAWPLVALEARASGCEVIMSDRCGNRFDLAARVVRFGDVEAMAREMLRVEEGGVGGKREPLEEWDCSVWAQRTRRICKFL